MKKLIAIIFSVVMLASLSCVTVSAYGFELGEYGQETYYTGPAVEQAPVMDGVISEGEYTLMITMSVADDEANDDYYISNLEQAEGFEYVNVYIAQDADFIYFATEQKDAVLEEYFDALYLNIGVTSDVNVFTQIYLPHCAEPEILTETNRGDWFYYYNGYAGLNEGDVTVYEIAVSRAQLAKLDNVEDFDCVLFSVSQRIDYDPVADTYAAASLAFYHETVFVDYADTQGYPTHGYPHILVLGDESVSLPNDETEAPATEAPETNAPETEAPETNAPETAAPETNAPETNAPETNAPETEAPKTEGGCGASVAAVAVALVATLGTCAVFVSKRK